MFSRAPFSLLGSLARTHLVIPYYHMVSDEQVPHVAHLYRFKTTAQFNDDLDFLLNTYTPITLSDLLAWAKAGRSIPDRAFLLTFDDGFREMSDIVAPILQKKGISATFFVNSAFLDNRELCHVNKASLIVEHLKRHGSPALEQTLSTLVRASTGAGDDIPSRVLSIDYRHRRLLDEIATVIGLDFSEYLSTYQPYLTSAQIHHLIAQGFTVGAHSIDHPEYLSLSLDEQLHQTIESVTLIRETFRLSYGVFAFPFSDHNISREFFARLSHSSVDLSFGTAGLLDDSTPKHFQRFSLEKPLGTAQRIVAFHHVRRLRHLITKTSAVVRG